MIDGRAATAALHAALDGTLAGAFPAGLGKAPQPPTLPYLVIYSPIAAKHTFEGMSGGDAARRPTYQISIAAQSEAALEVVGDQVIAFMADPANVIAGAGYRLEDRRLVSSSRTDDTDDLLRGLALRFSCLLVG